MIQSHSMAISETAFLVVFVYKFLVALEGYALHTHMRKKARRKSLGPGIANTQP